MVTARDSGTAVAVSRIAAALAATTVGAMATVDPDLWGHVRFGLDLLDTRTLTSHDPYSFTQDVPWINHEWLSELIFAAAYRIGGVPSLVLLKTALVVAVAWLLWPLTHRVTPRLRGALVVLCLVGMAPSAVTFRPQLWTLLGLALLMRVLVDRRSLLWLVILFPIWANLHGGWIVGGGVAALWTVGRVLDDRSVAAALPFVPAGVAALLGTLINPYGWGLWAFLLTTVRMGRDITEWQPLWRQEGWGHAILWAIVASVVIVGAVRRWRRLSWAAVLPVAWLGLSGLFVDRLTMLFCEASILVNAQAWADERPRTDAAEPPVGRTVVNLIAVAALWMAIAVPTARCLAVSGGWVPDLQAAGALSNPAVSGRLVVPFDWGQYALWHWGPRLRVSMDGRRETVYSEQTVSTQAALVNGEPVGLAFLARERPEYAWLPSASANAAAWLRANGYRVDIETPASFVATRADLPPVPPGPPASVCFP